MVQPGTYFYHGHYGMQRAAGLYGSLIVDLAKGQKEPFHYDGEFNLLLSDWWHKSTHEQEIGLSSKPFKWINEPQVNKYTYLSFLSFLICILSYNNNNNNGWLTVKLRNTSSVCFMYLSPTCECDIRIKTENGIF